MIVNPKVDKLDGLIDVPGLNVGHQTVWKIRLIKINGRSPPLAALRRWESSAKSDFNKIMTVMRLVGAQRPPPLMPFVGKSKFADLHEMRADKGGARLVYFYDRPTGTVVCAKDYENSTVAEQETAFSFCETIRQYYLTWPLSLKSS